MRDKTNDNIIKIGIAVFIVIILVMFGFKACSKEEVPEETSAPVMDNLETKPSGEGAVIESAPSVSEDSEPEKTKEEIEIDDIIDQLISDVNQEPATPQPEKEDTENQVVNEQSQNEKDIEKSIRESLGISDESAEELDSVIISPDDTYDSDNNPYTREIQGYEIEVETEIGEDGTPVETPEYKIQRVYKHETYRGAIIEKNESQEMHVGKIYHYFNDDGSKYGEAGDIVMVGKIGVDIAPGAARDGYYLNSYKNSVEIDTAVGLVKITKLNTDSLRVAKMTDAQIRKLAGDNSLTYRYLNATEGIPASYSTVLFDPTYTNGVQYYSCGYGIYEFKYYGRYSGVGLNLTGIVLPDSTTN